MMRGSNGMKPDEELDPLRLRVSELEEALAGEIKRCADLAMRYERSEEALRGYSDNLEERMKELRCLYGISSIIEKQDLTLEEILQKAADVIPPGWRFNDIARARIILFGREYPSRDFATSPWSQAGEIFVHGEKAGTIEV